MTPDSVRTDALQPGDQIRHPHDWTLFTVSAAAEPLDDLGSPLDFHNRETDEFERGMRVTGTDVSGENVHVDTAPSYLWHREGRQATAPQDDVRAELTAEFVAWLVKKAREHRAQGPQYAKQADVIGRLASKVQRGAVRANNLLMLPAQGGPEDDVLAAQVAEHGPFPMSTGDPASALTGAAIEAKVYDSLVSFNSVACWSILQLAQMRQYLAEHLAADLAPEVDRLDNDVIGANLARYEEEQDNARLRLALASAQRGRRELREKLAGLRQGYAALEARCDYIAKAAVSWRKEADGRKVYGLTLRARVAELEAQAEKVTAFCAQRAEYVSNLREFVEGGEHDYYRWTGHAEARRQLSQSLGQPVAWPAEDQPTSAPAGDDDSHEQKVAAYLATPYTDDVTRPRQFTPMQVLARDVETAIAPLTGDAKAGAEMVLRYIRTLAAEATIPTVEATA